MGGWRGGALCAHNPSTPQHVVLVCDAGSTVQSSCFLLQPSIQCSICIIPLTHLACTWDRVCWRPSRCCHMHIFASLPPHALCVSPPAHPHASCPHTLLSCPVLLQQARDEDYLGRLLLNELPALGERVQMIREGKAATNAAENDRQLELSQVGAPALGGAWLAGLPSTSCTEAGFATRVMTD